jgi:hypothetical protein
LANPHHAVIRLRNSEHLQQSQPILAQGEPGFNGAAKPGPLRPICAAPGTLLPAMRQLLRAGLEAEEFKPAIPVSRND